MSKKLEFKWCDDSQSTNPYALTGNRYSDTEKLVNYLNELVCEMLKVPSEIVTQDDSTLDSTITNHTAAEATMLGVVSTLETPSPEVSTPRKVRATTRNKQMEAQNGTDTIS